MHRFVNRRDSRALQTDAVLPRADYDRIQNIVRGIKPVPPQREMPSEEKLQAARDVWKAKLPNNPRRLTEENKQKEIDKLEMISREEAAIAKAKRLNLLQKADDMLFQRDECVKKFNSTLQMQWGKKENQLLKQHKINRKESQAEAERQWEKSLNRDFYSKMVEEEQEQQLKREASRQKDNLEDYKRILQLRVTGRKLTREETIKNLQKIDQELKQRREQQEELKKQKRKIEKDDLDESLKKKIEHQKKEERLNREVDRKVERYHEGKAVLKKKMDEFVAEDKKQRQAVIDQVSEKLAAHKKAEAEKGVLLQERRVKRQAAEDNEKAIKRERDLKQRAIDLTKDQMKVLDAQAAERAQQRAAEREEDKKTGEEVAEADLIFNLYKEHVAAEQKKYSQHIEQVNSILDKEVKEKRRREKREDDEEAFLSRQQHPDHVRKLSKYLKEEMAKAEENELEMEPLQRLNLFNYGIMPSTEKELKFGQTDPLKHLPYYETETSNLFKRCQVLKSMNSQLASNHLPRIQREPRIGITVSDFLKVTNKKVHLPPLV